MRAKKLTRVKKMIHIVQVVAIAIFSMIVITGFSLLFSIEAQSRTKEAALFDNHFYQQKEKDFRQDLKTILESFECKNSGITMTRTVSLDEGRNYQVVIHNKCFSYLSEKEIAQLKEEMEKLTIKNPDGECVPVFFELTGFTS